MYDQTHQFRLKTVLYDQTHQFRLKTFLLITSKYKAFRKFALVFAKTVLMAWKKVGKGKSKIHKK